ncbi:MAG: hypothetical protein ABIN58_00805 [candidate division WOR-3 bacterium]
MALTYIRQDGFDHLGGNLDPKYDSSERVTGSPGLSSPGVYSYGKCVNFGNSTFDFRVKLPGAPHTVIFAGFHVNWLENNATEGDWVTLYDAASPGDEVKLTRQFNGVSGRYDIRLKRGTTLLATASGALPPMGVWAWVSIMGYIHSSSGRFKMDVNGVNVIDFTGNTQNTAAARIDRLRMVAGNWQMDNLVIATGLTSDSLIPECRIYTQVPTGNDSVQFTANGAASQYQCVDEIGPNDDTDYNSSTTAGQQDTFSMAAPSIGSTVLAVNVIYDARKDDAGTRTMRAVIKPTTTAYDSGADDTLTSSYFMYNKIWQTNPDTSAAWTPSEATACKFGYKITA